MIIHIVDINGMAVIEAERNTPIPGDRYSPIARKASLERMQVEPRNTARISRSFSTCTGATLLAVLP
jgi:hypothetical protein